MSFAHYIKEIGRGVQDAGDLSEQDAYQLFGAMLDGGVPELEECQQNGAPVIPQQQNNAAG